MKTIGIEEHFATQEYIDLVQQIVNGTYPDRQVLEMEKNLAVEVPFAHLALHTPDPEQTRITNERLLDIGEGRIKVMDQEGITMQVLSHISPSIQIFEPATAMRMAKMTNDRLAETVRKYPDRFAAMAAIPPQCPTEAAQELERAVKELGLKGVSINSHTQNEYLDNKKFWPILAKAEELDVPIYLHPRSPSPSMFEPFGTYPELTGAMMGFGVEASLHAMRMICGGVFDEFPKLKVVLGHLGEAIPFWIWRMDNRLLRTPLGAKYKRLPSQIFAENFYVTTSGNFSQVAFETALHVVGVDHILFAVDYPMESNVQAVEFLKSLPLSPIDKEKIAHGNAERLYKLG